MPCVDEFNWLFYVVSLVILVDAEEQELVEVSSAESGEDGSLSESSTKEGLCDMGGD